jgi:predicted nucleic acid-binding protein
MNPSLKLVIDTNVFVESIPQTSPYHRIFTALLTGEIQL